ncbi:MAG: hypothetical protein ACYCX4_04695 [Bacillota bacterium]
MAGRDSYEEFKQVLTDTAIQNGRSLLALVVVKFTNSVINYSSKSSEEKETVIRDLLRAYQEVNDKGSIPWVKEGGR